MIMCVVFVKMRWKPVELIGVYKTKTFLWDPKYPKYYNIFPKVETRSQ
jgi:hypothetical protein